MPSSSFVLSRKVNLVAINDTLVIQIVTMWIELFAEHVVLETLLRSSWIRRYCMIFAVEFVAIVWFLRLHAPEEPQIRGSSNNENTRRRLALGTTTAGKILQKSEEGTKP